MKNDILPPQVKVTYDYELFKIHPNNREVPDGHKYILKSISLRDITKYSPIIVDSDFFIIDGQHRFFACKHLRKPIYYIQMEKDIDSEEAIVILNRAQRPWTQIEYLKFNASKYGGCYKEMWEYYKEHSALGFTATIEIFPANAINTNDLKLGKRVFAKNPLADEIMDFLASKEVKLLFKSYPSRAFCLAVRKAFEMYDKKQLEKIKGRLVFVEPCANYMQYLTAFSNLLKLRNVQHATRQTN